MKKFGKRLIAVALTGALASGLCLQASAFTYPTEYWPLQASWNDVQINQDVAGTLSVAQQTYDLFQGYALGQEVCLILEPICGKAAWCCELQGDIDGAVVWLQRQQVYAQWLNDNYASYYDTLLNINAQLNQLQRTMEVYTLAQDPADVPYYGVTGEPVSGVYYGTVAEGNNVNDSAALVYVTFQDGYTMDYWLDYFSNMNATVDEALNHGGVVEVAWNFSPESSAGVERVLAADSYIAESVAALGARNCTVLLRLGAEVNCWPELPDPQRFIQAFQKIATVAHQYPNIAVVFSPNDVSSRLTNFEAYYPGDAYVDWIGVSSYKDGGPGYGSSFVYTDTAHVDDAFPSSGIYNNDPITVLQDLNEFARAHNKPMMISECGMGHYDKSTGADQTAWAASQLTKFYSYIPMVYPQVKAMFYFDIDLAAAHHTYALSNNGTMLSTYRQAVSGGPFLQGIGTTQGAAYTRLSTVNEVMDTLNLYTYAIFPGSGSATCQYFLDGALAYTATSEPFAYSLDVSSLTPGAHTLTVTASRDQFSKTITRTFYVGSNGSITGSDALPLDLSTASGWAAGNLLGANSLGLITSRTSSNFTANITRLQFAELAVNLIEKATGSTLPTGNQSFTDTSDPVALKAAQAGITGGTGAGTFSPDNPITRQEICVMLKQVIRCVDEATGSNTLTNQDTTLNSQITDADQIDSWALESMALMNNNGLMSGDNNMLFPKSSTSIEQAITMILALYNKF